MIAYDALCLLVTVSNIQSNVGLERRAHIVQTVNSSDRIIASFGSRFKSKAILGFLNSLTPCGLYPCSQGYFNVSDLG